MMKANQRPRCTPWRGSSAVLLALLLFASGCYRNIPLGNGPPPGARVVAALTSKGTEEMSERIGADVVRVEAEAVGVHEQQWDMRLVRTWDRAGREFPWAGESVTFPREYLNRVERRELDRKRSWLMAGGVTVGAVALGRMFLKGVFGDDGGKDGTAPVQ